MKYTERTCDVEYVPTRKEFVVWFRENLILTGKVECCTPENLSTTILDWIRQNNK